MTAVQRAQNDQAHSPQWFSLCDIPPGHQVCPTWSVCLDIRKKLRLEYNVSFLQAQIKAIDKDVHATDCKNLSGYVDGHGFSKERKKLEWGVLEVVETLLDSSTKLDTSPRKKRCWSWLLTVCVIKYNGPYIFTPFPTQTFHKCSNQLLRLYLELYEDVNWKNFAEGLEHVSSNSLLNVLVENPQMVCPWPRLLSAGFGCHAYFYIWRKMSSDWYRRRTRMSPGPNGKWGMRKNLSLLQMSRPPAQLSRPLQSQFGGLYASERFWKTSLSWKIVARGAPWIPHCSSSLTLLRPVRCKNAAAGLRITVKSAVLAILGRELSTPAPPLSRDREEDQIAH